MANATANGLDVLEARIHLPRQGRWWADLAVNTDAPDKLTGAVTLVLSDTLTLVGTALRVGEYAGTVTCSIVGGAGGLQKVLKPKAYQGVPLRLPLQDALAEVGEALSPTSDADALNEMLSKWIRMSGPAMGELEALLGEAPDGTVCRVLADGTVWVGQETWPEATTKATVLQDLRWCGQVELGVEAPELLPGTTFMDRKVEHVEHRLSPESVRTIVQFADDPAGEVEASSTTEGDRLLQVIDRRLASTRFQRLFPAKVVKQNDDLTLELVLDDAVAPGLSNVPMRTFAPSIQVKVAPSSRCAVAFENGDPQQPVATLFEMGSLLELALNASGKVTIKAAQVLLGDGTTPVALEGSATKGHTHEFVLTAPPNGGLVTGSLALAIDNIDAGAGSSKVKA
jgi:hypothetical protein